MVPSFECLFFQVSREMVAIICHPTIVFFLQRSNYFLNVTENIADDEIVNL